MQESTELRSDNPAAAVTSALSGEIARPNARRLAIAAYVSIAFLYWIALYTYVPTLPTYVQSKTANLAAVGPVLSMYGLWQMIVRLPLGIIADRIGRRKPFILGGLVLVGLGAWIMGSTSTTAGLTIGRAVTGLAAATWVPLVVVFSSLFPAEEAVRASAILTLVGSVGRIFATAANGPLNNLGGYPLAFWIAVGVAAVALVLATTVQEKRNPPKQPSAKSIGRLITRRDVLLPALLSATVQFATWATTFGFLPILAKGLGANDVTLSTMVTLNLIMGMLGNLTATTLVGRLGAARLAIVSFVLLSAGIALTALLHSLPYITIAQLGVGLATGVAYPVMMGMSIRYVADAERATAMGLHQSVYAAGMFLGPWLGGILADAFGIREMFGVTALLVLVVGLIGSRLLTERQRVVGSGQVS